MQNVFKVIVKDSSMPMQGPRKIHIVNKSAFIGNTLSFNAMNSPEEGYYPRRRETLVNVDNLRLQIRAICAKDDYLPKKLLTMHLTGAKVIFQFD